MSDDKKKLTDLLLQRQIMISAAESCTAGLMAKLLTDEAGSSQWFERGFVTYSNESKQEMLGVPEQLLEEHGAVSEPVVLAMAQGALSHSRADVSLAISGIAGPDGGTEDKPVGTVWFAWAAKGRPPASEKQLFSGDRDSVRQQAADHAIRGMLTYLQSFQEPS